MLQRFSTGLISGEFGGQHAFSIKFDRFFFCTMRGWPWLRVLAPRLDERHACGDWNWTIFACLLLHSRFYGEGQASLLSLICFWCSNRQSKSVLGVKNVSQWDRGLSFSAIWSILNFLNLICWRNFALLRTPNNIIFWIGQLKQIFRTFVRKKKIILFFRSEVFVLLSKFQSSCTLLGCEQRFLLPSQRSPTFAFHKPPDGVFSPNMAFAF